MLKLVKYALSVLSLVLSAQFLLRDVSRVFKDTLLTQKQTPVQLPMIASLDNIKIHLEDVEKFVHLGISSIIVVAYMYAHQDLFLKITVDVSEVLIITRVNFRFLGKEILVFQHV